MSTDAELAEPVRLDVVAALVETDAATSLPGQATCDERRLADALCGKPEGTPEPEAPALCEESGSRAQAILHQLTRA